MQQLEIFKGNSLSLKITVTNNDTGELFDLTGFSAKFTIKANDRDTTYLLQETIEAINNPSGGVVVVDLSPQKTENLEIKNCVWDVEIANTNRSKVYTVATGRIQVKQKISN